MSIVSILVSGQPFQQSNNLSYPQKLTSVELCPAQSRNKMQELLSTLFSVVLLACIGQCLSFQVSELKKQIRDNTEQKEVQVQKSRETLSSYHWEHFSEAVVLVNDYQKFVQAEEEQFITVSSYASTECLESLPKPLYSIRLSADYNIGLCIGHMAVYGNMLVDDTEGEISVYNGIASQFPTSAMKEYFMSDWASEAGVQATHELLIEKMQHWDNVSTMEMFDLKKRALDDLEFILQDAWTVCVNYGRKEVKKLFDQALNHIEGCAKKLI